MSRYLIDSWEQIISDLKKTTSLTFHEREKMIEDIIIDDSIHLGDEKMVPYSTYFLDLHNHLKYCANGSISSDVSGLIKFRNKIHQHMKEHGFKIFVAEKNLEK